MACGWVLGYLLAQLLGLTVFNAAISLRLPVLPITLVLSLLVAILAAIVPVRRAVSVEPAKVLKGSSAMSVTHIPQVAIETRHLYKRFGDVTATDDINLRIAQGELSPLWALLVLVKPR